MAYKYNALTGKFDLTVGENDDVRIKSLETVGTGDSEFYGGVLLTTLLSKGVLGTDSTGKIIEGGTELDGGSASSVYLTTQSFNCGGA